MPEHGWLGGRAQGYETLDGGISWRTTEFGAAVNKIRIVRGETGTDIYAIGSSVTKPLSQNARAPM